MTSWLPPAILSLFSFGLWGFFSKIAVLHIDSKSALFFQAVGVFVIGLFTLAMIGFKPETEWKGVSYGLLTGIASGVGCLFYMIAANKGKNVTIVALTSLYPIITILLSYIILREGIQLRQAVGIVFALLALYLLA